MRDAQFKNTGLLSYKLFRKPTAQHVPLGRSSVHTLNVHASWPIAEIRRVAKRSSAFPFFRSALRQTVDRWHMFDLKVDLEPLCLTTFFHTCNTRPIKDKTSQGTSFWLVLPSSFSLRSSGIRAVMHGLLEMWRKILFPLFGEFELRLGFSSAFPNLGARVQVNNRIMVR